MIIQEEKAKISHKTIIEAKWANKPFSSKYGYQLLGRIHERD
jgi:hypothetical protein